MSRSRATGLVHNFSAYVTRIEPVWPNSNRAKVDHLAEPEPEPRPPSPASEKASYSRPSKLGESYPSTGVLSELAHLFLCTRAQPKEGAGVSHRLGFTLSILARQSHLEVLGTVHILEGFFPKLSSYPNLMSYSLVHGPGKPQESTWSGVHADCTPYPDVGGLRRC